jgi:flavin-dependent dehydrogenase
MTNRFEETVPGIGVDPSLEHRPTPEHRPGAEHRQVVVIGAGPAGSIASALLKRRGRDVLVLERQKFPRFSIGESLLVHCLDFVAEAGMLDAVNAAGFQYKDGAAFARGDAYSDYDFSDRFTPGRGSTFQVQRAKFDQILADEAAKQGVEIRYEVEITAVSAPDAAGHRTLTARSVTTGETRTIQADFILDASGFGRTLPKLLDLELPSKFPTRQSIFTHVADGIAEGAFDRKKIRVTVHPEHQDVWFWLIPFSGGRCSLGVVATKEFLDRYPGPPEQKLRALVAEDRGLASLLADAQWDTPVRELHGYAANVKSMFGSGFALLGNAAEFLDPVFSSGVTIAMRSASMAVGVLDRQLAGQSVDWKREFEEPLRKGVDCFRAYVEAWYDGRFQSIVFSPGQTHEIRRMISSVLAGYAWDEKNPFVADPQRRLNSVAAWATR